MKRISKLLTGMFLVLFAFILCHTSNVLAADDQVKSIEITKLPTKCAYNVGDPYTTAGMEVKATLTNGKKVTVDLSKITSFSGVTLEEGRLFEQEGWKGVTIKYEGATASFGIAVFDPSKEYSIVYNSDGGTAVNAQKIDASTKAFNLPKPRKNGYKFLGWYHSNGYKYTKFTPGMGPSINLTAKWALEITFNANGGKGKMAAGAADNSKLPKCKFTKAGYKFVGWSTKKQATDYTNFFEPGSVPYFDANKTKGGATLYAQWVKPATYTIKYIPIKGAKIPSKAIKKYTSGKTTLLPFPEIEDDMNFVGWIVTKNGKKYTTTTELLPFMTGNLTLKPYMVPFRG